MSEIEIQVQPTPNPNALKFMCNKTIKADGKSTFKDPYRVHDIPLAKELFDLRGVDQLHLFENVVTVTKFTFEPWESLEPKICLLYTSPSPRDATLSRMPSSA